MTDTADMPDPAATDRSTPVATLDTPHAAVLVRRTLREIGCPVCGQWWEEGDERLCSCPLTPFGGRERLAVESAIDTLKPGAPYFIWRYPDGRHDWSSNPRCEPLNNNAAAVLVSHGHTPGFTSASWRDSRCPICSPSAAQPAVTIGDAGAHDPSGDEPGREAL